MKAHNASQQEVGWWQRLRLKVGRWKCNHWSCDHPMLLFFDPALWKYTHHANNHKKAA
jgi:hypothetical protein